MNIEKTELEDVYVLSPKVFIDNRGCFMEVYKDSLLKTISSDFKVVQENMSRSKQNVFRGIHFQKPPYEQAKLVQCIEGCIIDIAVDIRPNSPKYMKYVAVELSSDNNKLLFIPRGFAHAFFVKSDNATMLYRVDNIYNPSSEGIINYLDINIDFEGLGINPNTLILSDKDRDSKSHL